MDELASAAGISKRTVYSYFKSKDELIETVIDNVLNGIGEEIDSILKEYKSADEIFEHLPKAFYEFTSTIFTPLIIEELQQQYPRYWEKINNFRLIKVKKAIDIVLENDKSKYDHRIISAIVLSSLQAVVNPDFLISNNIRFDTAVKELVRFYKYGFSSCINYNE